MKALKKNDLGVSPVIAVILMVAITVVLAGVVFLWAQSFTDDAEGGVETINVKGEIDVNGVTDTTPDPDVTYSSLQLEVISGTISWADYKITVSGTEVHTIASASVAGGIPTSISTNSGDSSAGESQLFTINTFTGGAALSSGSEYTVKIVNIADNKVVWEDDIIATA